MVQDEAAGRATGMRPLDWANGAGFAVYAGSATITPISLLVLAQELGFSLAAAGTLEIARSFLIVLALLASGFLAGRFGKARSLSMSCGILSLGLLCYGLAPSFGVVVLALAVAGAGGGVIEGLINPLVQDQHPRDSGRYLNIVNGFWSVGVVATMVFGGELLTQGQSWRLLIIILAACALVAALGYGWFAHQEREQARQPTLQVWRHSQRILGNRHFWWFWAMMVLAGGAEGALTFWTASYIQLEFAASARLGGIGVALFGVGMIGGRFLAGILIAQHRLLRAMLGSALLAAVACALLPWLPSLALLFAALVLAGFGLACLWPSLQSYAAEQLPLDTTMLFILLSCGGIPGYALAAWAMGLGIDYAGFTVGFLGIAAALLLLALMLLLTRRGHAPVVQPG